MLNDRGSTQLSFSWERESPLSRNSSHGEMETKDGDAGENLHSDILFSFLALTNDVPILAYSNYPPVQLWLTLLTPVCSVNCMEVIFSRLAAMNNYFSNSNIPPSTPTFIHPLCLSQKGRSRHIKWRSLEPSIPAGERGKCSLLL